MNADLVFAADLQPGVNEIFLTLVDWGGIVGFNYGIDLSVEADEPFTFEPTEVSCHCAALQTALVERLCDAFQGSGPASRQELDLVGNDLAVALAVELDACESCIEEALALLP